MKAIGLTQYGGPAVLHLIELPEPHAGAGEVRVRVHAAAINPVDALLRNGSLASAYASHQPPFVPGMDISGTIDQIGPDIDPNLDLHVGQAVVGLVNSMADHGGYSEQVVLPTASVTAIPADADWAHAASFLMNALAARNALDRLKPPAGETVLVTGAAGALGSYAVPLAHEDGLRVIALAADEDEPYLRSLGADEFVARGDRAAERVPQIAADGVDAVIDAALLFDEIAPAVRDGGKLVDLRSRDGDLGRGIKIIHADVRQRMTDHAAIVRLREQVESGLLPMRVAQTFPATSAVEAHRLLDKGNLHGRIVLLFDAPNQQ